MIKIIDRIIDLISNTWS